MWELQSGDVTREKNVRNAKHVHSAFPLAEMFGLSWRARSGPTWCFYITRKM